MASVDLIAVAEAIVFQGEHGMELEQVWNFYVKPDFEFEQAGNDFFAERAANLAEAIGYQVEAVGNVELKINAGLKRFVTGNVRLAPRGSGLSCLLKCDRDVSHGRA